MRLILISIILFTSPFVGCGSDTHESDNFNFTRQPLAIEINKGSVKSLEDIRNDLAKVKVDCWDMVCDGTDSLGNIALDFEKSLIKPLGEFASRAVLLDKSLIIVLKRGFDIKDDENIVDKIFDDAHQLKIEINQEISVTPEIEVNIINFLNKLRINVDEIVNNAENLYKIKIDYIKNRHILLENNAYLAQRNFQICKDNVNLVREQKKLREDLALAKAQKLMQELIDSLS